MSVLLLLVFMYPQSLRAQQHHQHGRDASSQADTASHHSHLHFSHPLISESVSPDTKVRFDYLFRDAAHKDHVGAGHDHETATNVVRLEGEYAFHRSFSIEAILPFRIEGSETVLEHAHVAFKFANFAFENRGLLLGYGLEVGLPGGHAEGVEHGPRLEVGPFLNAGYQWRRLEVVAFTTFELPANQREEVETELTYNLSSLYHVSSRIQALLELDGESVLAGAAPGETALLLTPGIKIQPWAGRALRVGLGVSFPLSEHRVYNRRVFLSAFYHF